MLRIHPTHDWHIDIEHNGDYQPPDIDLDVVIANVGDVRAPGTLAIKDYRRRFPKHEHLLYTAGNHDFYSDHRSPELKTTWEEQRARMPEVARAEGVTFLDDAVAEICGVRFVGSTLWTDLMLRPGYLSFADAQRAAMQMNDYRLTKTGRGRSHDTLKTRDTIAAHKVSRVFIETELAKPFDGETVVMTHHAPSRQSLLKPDSLQNLDWCYASDLEFLMHTVDSPQAEKFSLAPTHVPPSLWLHGHVHRSLDYTIGACRVICNARGYPMIFHKNAPRENPNFDPGLIVELGYECVPRIGGM